MKYILQFLIISFSLSGLHAQESVKGIDPYENPVLLEELKDIFNQPYIRDTDPGDYKLEMIGHKFAAVYTRTGVPIAVFDLSMNPMSFKEYVLGFIGIKDLSIRGVLKHKKIARRARKEGEREARGKEGRLEKIKAPLHFSQRDTDHLFSKSNVQPMDFDGFESLSMNEKWARKKGLPKSADGVYRFKHGDFTAADLKFKDQRDEKIVKTMFKGITHSFYPNQNIEIDSFMDEIEFRYNPQEKHYKLVWNTKKRAKKEKRKLPGVVVNYLNPVSSIAFRNFMTRIDQLGYVYLANPSANIDISDPFRFFRVMNHSLKLVYMVISRITTQAKERVEYHENQFLGLLEASQRFSYEINLPFNLIEPTANFMYLSKIRAPISFNDGAWLRALMQGDEEENFIKVQKQLDKLASDEDTDFYVDHNHAERYIVARYKENKAFKGIYGAAVKPTWLMKRLSMHVNAKTPTFKMIERTATEIGALLAKAYIPTRMSISYSPNSSDFIDDLSIFSDPRNSSFGLVIGIELPFDWWEHVIKRRMRLEMLLEARLSSLVEENLRGRYEFGDLTKDELMLVRNQLHQVNPIPYKVKLEEEAETIEKNLANLKQVLAGNPDQLLRPSELIPMSL